jgi:hypothetical protein
MNEMATFLLGLFQSLKSPARWIAVVGFLTLTIAAVVFYEHWTNHFSYSRLEQKLRIIHEMQTIADRGIEKHHDIFPIYKSAVEELNRSDQAWNFVSIVTLGFDSPATLWKAISGGALWLVVLVVGAYGEIKKAGRLTGVTVGVIIAVIVVGIIFAWIGTVIPTIISPWVNCVVFPLAQVTFFAALGRLQVRRTVVSPPQPQA